MLERILANLNDSQKAAVSCSAHALTILAGPGSGKTHTLTARTAWLLKHEGYQPWNVIVATFTVKAAKEMKERIGKLIGDGLESQLILGTFHSIARRYLVKYGYLINIPKDFGIADSSDSLAIIKRIIKRHNLTLDPSAARSRISSRKAKGAESSSRYRATPKSVEVQEFETCFLEYGEALDRAKLLDYDDLLLRCVELLRAHPSCVSNIESVLIDEFQDTNLVQFDLMRLFAAHRKRVTIVGDPDQSIYGFRSAETQNFKRMLAQYPDTITIPLEENYRSSGSILLAALEVIQQDGNRIAKSLMPIHCVGTQPVLRLLATAQTEAQWIVTEILRILALSGNLMSYSDVAILLRSASLSRHIEGALGKAGIPYRMVGGHRFYDRVEVKVVLDYLRVVEQPDNNDAMARILNVPSRRIGDVTIKALIEEADRARTTLWKLALDVVQGNITIKTKLAKQTEQGLSAFVNVILTIRKRVLESAGHISITEMINMVSRKVSLEDFLKKNYTEDYESRMANVQELLNLASDYTSSTSNADNEDGLPEIEGLLQNDTGSPLSRFLANIALASDAKASDTTTEPQAHLVISTIHAAKGLEWPVVFIPAVYQGSIPHSRSDDTDEERRLLYVAMTRAKALLYMSCPLKDSQREETVLSPFLAAKSLKPHMMPKGPKISTPVIQSIARILHRDGPSTFDIDGAISALMSFEDDLWPTTAEAMPEEEARWDAWNGSHHYTKGQQPAKRRRIDLREVCEVTEMPSDKFQYGQKTTMQKSSSFSIATNAVQNGFVTAASHAKILAEQGSARQESRDKYEKDSIAPSKCNRKEDSLSHEDSTTNEPLTTRPRTNKRAHGQASIANFFRKPTTTCISLTQPELRIPKFSSPPRALTKAPDFETAVKIDLAIPVDLSTHKLRPSPFRETRLQQHKGCQGEAKAYVFLSSSPPPPEIHQNCHSQEVPKSMSNVEAIEETVSVRVDRPAATMHVTSIARLNTINGPRKTLGVRRSLTGWSDRMHRTSGTSSFRQPP